MGEIKAGGMENRMLTKKKKSGSGRKKKRARERDKAGPKNGRDHGFHLVATKDIKLKDLTIGERFRQPPDDDVAKLAESLKTLGQTRAITVRPRRMDGKYPVIAGATLVMAAKMLKRTSIRVDIVRCTDAAARQWEIAENLYRAHLTPLEEAKHMAAWMRTRRRPRNQFRDGMSLTLKVDGQKAQSQRRRARSRSRARPREPVGRGLNAYYHSLRFFRKAKRLQRKPASIKIILRSMK